MLNMANLYMKVMKCQQMDLWPTKFNNILEDFFISMDSKYIQSNLDLIDL